MYLFGHLLLMKIDLFFYLFACTSCILTLWKNITTTVITITLSKQIVFSKHSNALNIDNEMMRVFYLLSFRKYRRRRQTTQNNLLSIKILPYAEVNSYYFAFNSVIMVTTKCSWCKLTRETTNSLWILILSCKPNSIGVLKYWKRALMVEWLSAFVQFKNVSLIYMYM